MGHPVEPESSQPLLDIKKADVEDTETLNLGVYRVIINKRISYFDAFSKLDETRKEWVETTHCLARLLKEVVFLQPMLLTFLVGYEIWMAMKSVLSLSVETKIFTVIERGLKDGKLETTKVVTAVLLQLGYVVVGACIDVRCNHIQPEFNAALDNYYTERLMKAKLNLDLPTLHENEKIDRLDPCLPRSMVMVLLVACSRALSLLGSLGLVLRVANSGNEGMMFAVVCLIDPISKIMMGDSLMNRPRVVSTTNEHFNRMWALKKLTEKDYRHEIISGNLVGFIAAEYRKAREALGNISTEDPEIQYFFATGNSFMKHALESVVGHLPMIYIAFIVLLRPTQISLALIATLQNASTHLRGSFHETYNLMARFQLADLKQFYKLENIPVTVKDGEKPYPTEDTSGKGVSFELKNVVFSYPHNPDATNVKRALDDVSFRIEAGELVIVVGANGSGKSTFINLLMRMYDVSSGEILVDGADIRSLSLSHYRQATAVLTQDHRLLPLSIAENIGLGDPENVDNMDMILDAARKGGCEEVVKKLESGFDTVLADVGDNYSSAVDETKKDRGLYKAMKKLWKNIEVSGGERQRLVAARTFMRFNSGLIKFVAVDEPSSALDPNAEVELFNNLREAREGKTMLFVTHRFGPITKFADRIICMKEGKVVEYGTHTELMAKEGEYYKMYNVQAKAFDHLETGE